MKIAAMLSARRVGKEPALRGTSAVADNVCIDELSRFSARRSPAHRIQTTGDNFVQSEIQYIRNFLTSLFHRAVIEMPVPKTFAGLAASGIQQRFLPVPGLRQTRVSQKNNRSKES
jgi:hypothetical protein